MKRQFSTIKSHSLLNHFMRLAIVLVFLSLAVGATAGNSWTATYKVNVKLYPNSTGKGKVYLNSNAQKTVSNTEASDQIQETGINNSSTSYSFTKFITSREYLLACYYNNHYFFCMISFFY